VSYLSIELRPVTSSDHDFLAEVYRQTRWEELTVTGWPDAQKRAFLGQQFALQTTDWNRHYPDASRNIILVNRQPAGRLYVERQQMKRELRVVDIALLPSFRKQGIGTRIFQRLFTEADTCGWAISLHVERHNPARHLYTRLGFNPVQNRGSHLFMNRLPSIKTMVAHTST
jgi:GNAT superfamily N-acetyltransferase